MLRTGRSKPSREILTSEIRFGKIAPVRGKTRAKRSGDGSERLKRERQSFVGLPLPFHGRGWVKFVRNSSRRSGAGSNRIDPSKPVKRQNKAEIKHPDRKMEPPFVRTMNAGWSAAFAGLPYRSGTLHRRQRRQGVHHGSPCRPKIFRQRNLPCPTLRPGRPKRNQLPEFRPVEPPEHLQPQPRSRSTDRPL